MSAGASSVTKQTTQVVTPSAASLRRLLKAVRDLASAHDVADVADVVRHAARELVDADGATFVLREADECYYVDEDAITPLWRGQRFPLDACVSGWSMEHKRSAVIPDIYVDDRVPHEAYRPTFVHSLTMTPVRSADPVAAIGTYWAHRHESSAAEVELLQALADSTAVALENVRVLADLESRVAQRTAELEATSDDLAAFAHLAAHDLKAPLATIASYAELARDLEGAHLSEQGAHALDVVERRAARMSELVDGVLAYSAGATAELEMQRIDFNDLVRDVLSDLRAAAEHAHAVIEVRRLPLGYGAPVLLERVLQNLITNAVRYGDPESPHVVVSGSRGERSVSVTVADNGPGVAPDERDTIFDMFVRGSAGSRTPGSGIGLALARRVVARHDGTLEVGAGPGGRGAAFTMTLPLPDDARH